MRSQRNLKSLAINPHSNSGNAVRFRLTQRIALRVAQSLRSNLLLDPSTAETIAKNITLPQVDMLNKFLPDMRDYFLNLIQTKQLIHSQEIKKSLQRLSTHFDVDFKNFYDNFLADKIADKFVVTLTTLVEMRELLGHNNATAAFKILSQLNESGISQVTPFAIAAKSEMAKQVVMNQPRFSDIDLDDILSVDLFETFTELPESVRDELVTEDLLKKTIDANKHLISNRPSATELISDNSLEYEKKLWTAEKRIAALGHALTAEDIALLPQILSLPEVPEKPISSLYLLIMCIAALGFIVAGYKLSQASICDIDQDNKFIPLKKPRSNRSNALFQPMPAISETDDYTDENADEEQLGCSRRINSS